MSGFDAVTTPYFTDWDIKAKKLTNVSEGGSAYMIGNGYDLTAGHVVFNYGHAKDNNPRSITASDMIIKGKSGPFDFTSAESFQTNDPNLYANLLAQYATAAIEWYNDYLLNGVTKPPYPYAIESSCGPGIILPPANSLYQGKLVSIDSVVIKRKGASVSNSSAGLALFYNPGDMKDVNLAAILPGYKLALHGAINGNSSGKIQDIAGLNFKSTVTSTNGDSGAAYVMKWDKSSYVIGSHSWDHGTIDCNGQPVIDHNKGSYGVYFTNASFHNLNKIVDDQANLANDPTNLIVGVDRSRGNVSIGTLRRDLFIGTTGAEIFYASGCDVVNVGSGNNVVMFNPQEDPGLTGAMTVKFGKTAAGLSPKNKNGIWSGNTVVETSAGSSYVLDLSSDSSIKPENIDLIAGGQSIYWFPGSGPKTASSTDDWLKNAHVEFLSVRDPNSKNVITFVNQNTQVGIATKAHDGIFGAIGVSPITKIIFSDGSSWDTKAIYDHIKARAESKNGAGLALNYIHDIDSVVGKQLDRFAGYFSPDPLKDKVGTSSISTSQPLPPVAASHPVIGNFADASVSDIVVTSLLSPGHATTSTFSSPDPRILYGTTGSDTLDSGGAYTLVYGEGGGDTFIYNLAYGAVTLNEVETATTPNNVLQLGAGLTVASTLVSANDSGDIILDFGSGDNITLAGALLSANGTTYGVQAIRFADTTVWSYADLLSQLETPSLNHPVLYGDASANVLDGNGVSQTLEGFGGGDTFIFNKGYGEMAIEEKDTSSNSVNILQLGAGLSASSAIVTADASGTITIDFGGGDQVWLAAALKTGGGTVYGVQQIRFADATVWTNADLIGRLDVVNGNSTALYGDNTAQTFDTMGIDDTIIGGGGGDIITYNQGYGLLTITEADLDVSPVNVLHLGTGITAPGTTVTANSSGDLMLDFGSGDTIILTSALNSEDGTTYGVQTIDFADGTVWHYSDLLAAADTPSATNTTLYGDESANVLDGNGIADTLVGNGGGDTFFFDVGYGALTIAEADMSAAPDNVLSIGAGLSASSLSVTGNGNGDLILSFGGGDQVTLVYGLASGNGTTYGVQHVRFVGGMTLSYSDLLTLAETPSASQTTLYGDNSANVLDGGGIATTLIGGGNGDTFVFIQGYGTLTIEEADTSVTPNNVLEVGSGISAADTVVTADADGNLILDFGGGDRVILSDALNSAESTTYGLQQINFQGGTSLTYAQLLAMADTPSSTNTTLYGDTAANTLDGQGMAKTLVGNGGGDTFVFNQGYGALTIVENDPAGVEIDILQLGGGLTAANALVTANSNGDLLLNFGGGDIVTIQGAFAAGLGTFGSIQEVRFHDNTSWTYEQMLALATTGSASNTTLYGDGQGDTFDSKGFATTINSTGGGDTILYSLGYGALTINEADTGGNAANTLMLGVGISEGDVTPSSDAGGDIILSMGGGDVITLTSAMLHTDATAYGVQNILFADGRVWNIADLRYRLNPTADGMVIADGDFGEGIDTDVLDGGGYTRGSFDFTDSATSNYHTASVVSVSASGTVPEDLTNAQLLTLLHTDVGTDTSGSDVGSVDWGFASAGAFDYLLPGQSVILDYVVAVSDGHGGELRQNVSVTVNGSQSGGHYVTLFFHGITINYAINRGALEIADVAGGVGADNTLAFGTGITLSMLTVKANEGGDLILTINDGQSDQIIIDSALMGSSSSKRGIQNFTFTDGSSCTFAQLLAIADIGSAQNANGLFGDFNANIFDTAGYSHQISGRGGADTILYNPGYGSLYINEGDGSGNRAATLVFGAGIDPSDVTIRAGSDLGSQGVTSGSNRIDSLILNVAGSGTITITGMLSDLSGGIQSVQFQDGTVWSYQHMVASLGILHPSGYPFFGNGVLVGSTEADTLDPAGTARYVEGNGGGDTIIYERGYGALNIIEIDQTIDTNRLAFGQGIDPSDVTVTMTGVGSFVLSLGGGDVVTFQGSGGAAITGSFQNTLESYDNAYTGVEAVTFVDGTVWDISHLVDLANVPSTSHTTLYGDAASNTFDTAGIADTIYSAGTADHILYNQGYGSLTVNEDTQALDPANTIDFGQGITASMLTVTSSGADLYIGLGGGDSITISGALDNSPDRDDIRGIQKFTFADGSSLSYEDMLSLANTPSETNTTLNGDAYAQIFDSQGIANAIFGGGGADTFLYNRGYGALSITEFQGDGSSLQFGQSIDTTDITLGHQLGNVTVSLGNGDVITLLYQLPDQNGDAGGVDDFVFADGTVWDRDAITSRLIADSPGGPVVASGSNDALTAPAANDSWVFHSLPGGTISFADSDLGDLHSVTIGPVTATGSTTGLDLSSFNGDSAYSDGLAITVSDTENGNPGTIDWAFNYQNYDQGRFAYLGAGDEVTLSYVLTITDTLGRTANETVSITLTGPPAGPPVIASDTVATGAFTELAGATGSSTQDTASGAIHFTDPASAPNDAASILSVGASGATTGLPGNAALLTMLSLGTVSQPSGGNPGSVGWIFSAADSTFDYLKLGENLTLTYVVQVASVHGGSVDQNVVVTVTGTNDAPVVATGTVVANLTEQASITGSTGADTATGAVKFIDVDTGETHVVAVTGVVASQVTSGLPSNATVLGWLSMGAVTEQAGATPGSSTWSFSAPDNAFDYLAAGEKLRLVYTVRTTDAHGATLNQTVSVGVTGTNDAPVINGSTVATGSLTERSATTGSTAADTATGAVKFADADLSDTHTAAISSVTSSGTTAGLPANATLLGYLTAGTLSEQSGATPGSVPWTFSAPDNVFDYLQAGQTATLTYVVQVADNHGGTVNQNVLVTVTGTDDAPVVATGTVTAMLTEQASLTGSTSADTATGAVKFTDVDTGETHVVAVTGVVASKITTGAPSNATMLGWLSLGSVTEQAGATPGSSTWTFSAPDNAFDYLAVNESLRLTYTVQTTDAHGATLNQTVSINVTGTDDAPVAMLHNGYTTDNQTPLVVPVSSLLAGDTDPDLSDTLSVASVQAAVGGTVTLSGGNAVFTPTPTTIGAASFTYTISDGHGGTSTATTSLTTTLHQITGTSGSDTLAGGTQMAQIDGLGGNDTITAGSAGDTLIGGAGNDTLTGGAGVDTFAYHAGFGIDTINSFTPTGTSHDVLRFDTNIFSDWAHLLGATTQQGSDLLITLDSTDTITLKNVALANFTSADATFV